MDKSTGQPALDAKGNEITAEKEFAAEGFEGSVDIEFNFDGSGLAGTSLVAFESMLDAEGNVYMSHEDIGDEGQTVNVVDIAPRPTMLKPAPTRVPWAKARRSWTR